MPARRRLWPKFLGLVAVLVAVAVVAALTWWFNYVGSPQYSIAMLAHAVGTHDWPGVQRYVDVESIADSAVEAELARGLGDSRGPFERLARSVAETAKPALASAATDALHEAVVQENDWGAPAASELASILGVSALARIEVAGDTARVTIVPPARKETFRFRMTRADDHWRVAEVDDIVDVLTRITAASGVGSSGRAHPLFDLNRLRAKMIVDALVTLGAPITQVDYLTAATDPERLLGKPGGYLQKAVWTETGAGLLDPARPAGTVKIFASAEEAQRHSAASTATRITYQIGNAVVTVGGLMTPQRAAAYARVFSNVR